MAWIFKPIEDIKKEVFDELESTLSMQCKIGKYNQLMKERVDWTLFVKVTDSYVSIMFLCQKVSVTHDGRVHTVIIQCLTKK